MGSSATLTAYILLQQGRFDDCLLVVDDIHRVAIDASDPLLLGYALHTRAAVIFREATSRPPSHCTESRSSSIAPCPSPTRP